MKNWVEGDGDIMSGVRGSDVEGGVMVAVRSGVELIVRIQWYWSGVGICWLVLAPIQLHQSCSATLDQLVVN